MHDSLVNDESVVDQVHNLLASAIRLRASDIHLEQCADLLRVRFRIDGVLVEQRPFSTQLSSFVIARFKVISHLDSSERRLPQDGKFQYEHEGNVIDLRIATFPCVHGEKLVVRILDKSAQMIDLETLGFEPGVLASLKRLISSQNGFFIVTGPTGSGKTTTLYAALALLNTPDKNIVTLEDPVEYCLDGITQAQVHVGAGFTFEKGVRSIVRQDPDIIMIGEVRDTITARVAIESSLTGHMVLTTLHAGGAPNAIVRLIDMGIEPFLINASLSGVLAQRLARMLCGACCIKRSATDQEKYLLTSLGVYEDEIYDAAGCDECNGLGYKGRTGIFELLVISPEFRSLISARAPYDQIYQQALNDGMKTLLHDAVEKMKSGLISLSELVRVIL